ncbi:MAG: hypothetical protein O3A63_13970, partial [Proteobacteria bacterium]|nr:hypothetical protein [Pseudomonadota bacterium]
MAVKLLAALIAVILAGPVTANVDAQRIQSADDEPGSWLTHGRNYAEDRESPLTSIDVSNVSQLG